MSRTRMGPAACVVLSGALKDNTTIERLLLHDNPLGEVGAWHLMAAITANKNLEYIGLQGSNFISTGVTLCLQALLSISAGRAVSACCLAKGNSQGHMLCAAAGPLNLNRLEAQAMQSMFVAVLQTSCCG